jgi:phospholipid/cholesterol/gamma-HCH transport system substrate-binding protein
MELKSRYDDLHGLLTSAPVFIKGYKAGEVTEINYLSDDAQFEVVCSVLKDFKVPSDSKIIICSMDIMGGKGVKIDLGTSVDCVQDGSSLAGFFEQDLIGGLGESIGPLLEKVSSTLDSLSVTVSGVNQILSDQNAASISRTLAHLEKTMADVKAIASGVQGKSAELNNLIDNLASFSGKLGGIAEKVDTTMAGVSGVVDSLAAADLEGLVSSFKALVDNVNDPDGSIGKLMTDDSVYNSVDSLLIDINSLVKKIQENPKKYLKISVF